MSSVEWASLLSQKPFEALEWDEKTFLLALINGAKTKSEIFRTKPFEQLLVKVAEEDKLKACESIFRSAKKTLVRSRLVNYDEKSRRYSLNQDALDEISPLARYDFNRVTSDFERSGFARYVLGIGNYNRRLFTSEVPIIKYSVKPPVHINFEQENKFIRILAFSDWRVQDVNDALIFAQKVAPDFILYGGDDLGRFEIFGANQFTQLSKFGKSRKVFVVLGNDDFYSPAKQVLNTEGVHDLYKESMVCGNFAFIGLESSTRGPAIFRHEEQDFENHLAGQYEHLIGKNLVILSHTPPYGILDRGIRFATGEEGSDHIGSTALRRFIENNKVSLLICGHCHSYGGLVDKVGVTTVVNVASHDSVGPIGKLAIIDLYNDGRAEVSWHDTNELLDQHSVDKIWGIGFCYRRKLAHSGITTIKELAEHNGLEELSCSCGISPKVLMKFQLRARSMVEDKVFQVSPFIFPDYKLIFIDIETDLGGFRVWLIGLLVDGEFIQLYADNWGQEKDILIKFLEILKKHPGYKLVSYSGTDFDYRVPLRALKRHGLKTDLLESRQHFDLSYAVRNCFVFPNQSFALKELGAYLQYPFKFPELDGKMVAFKYVKHAEDGAAFSIQQ